MKVIPLQLLLRCFLLFLVLEVGIVVLVLNFVRPGILRPGPGVFGPGILFLDVSVLALDVFGSSVLALDVFGPGILVLIVPCVLVIPVLVLVLVFPV